MKNQIKILFLISAIVITSNNFAAAGSELTDQQDQLINLLKDAARREQGALTAPPYFYEINKLKEFFETLNMKTEQTQQEIYRIDGFGSNPMNAQKDLIRANGMYNDLKNSLSSIKEMVQGHSDSLRSIVNSELNERIRTEVRASLSRFETLLNNLETKINQLQNQISSR